MRRCTALILVALGLGFDALAVRFDETPFVVDGLLYLFVSAVLALVRHYDELVGISEPISGATDSEDGDDTVA